jgi:hypothetical protein
VSVEWLRLWVGVAGTSVLMGTSGLVLRTVLRGIAKGEVGGELEKKERDTGVVVGKCENILIVALVLLGAYTALSIIFAAKAWVRREDMSRNSLYFLAGTMVNVTYSLVFALALRWLVGTL